MNLLRIADFNTVQFDAKIPLLSRHMLQAIHLSLLLLCGFALSAQSLPARRVYFIGNHCLVADSLGVTTADYAASQVTVNFYPGLSTPSIRLRTPDESGYLKPNQFLKSNGLPYGTSVTLAFLAWNDVLGALASVGSGSLGTVAVANDLVTSDATKALAAPQGGALKSLIDANTTAIGQRLLSTTFNTQVTAQQGVDNGQNTSITANANAAATAQSAANAAQATANNAQPKIAGKSLSANDYTDADKAKVAATSGTNGGDQQLSISGGQLTISGANGNTVTIPSSSSYQPEIVTYLANEIAAGSTVDPVSLNALDRWVIRLKRAGIYSKLTFISPMMGSNLAGSLVNLKYPAGLVSNVNVGGNFVEADYTPGRGYYLSANTNKKISTGFIGANNGLTTTALSFGVFIGSKDDFSLAIVGTNPASGANNLRVYSNVIGSNIPSYRGGIQASSVSFNGSTITSANSGVQSLEGSSTSSVSPDTEFSFYGVNYNGNTVYTTGSLGFFWVGQPLTGAEQIELNLAVEELMKATGRMPTSDVYNFFGDSITEGLGLPANTALQQRFPAIVSNRLGVREYNSALPTGQFRQTAAPYVSGFLRYPSLLNPALGITTNVILYGKNDANIGDNASTTVAAAANVADFKGKMTTMINALQKSGQRIILCGLTWDKSGSLAKRTSWNAPLIDLATTYKLPYVDMESLFSDTGTPNVYFQADSLHPLASGHELMATAIVAASRGTIFRDVLLDFPSIAAGGIAELTVPLWTVDNTMVVDVRPPATLEAGLMMTRLVGKVGSPRNYVYAGGSGYTNGGYTNLATTGGSGTGARVTVNVASGAVNFVSFVEKGTGYQPGDVLTATIPGGSGFTITVQTVADAVTVRITNTTSADKDPAAGRFYVSAQGRN